MSSLLTRDEIAERARTKLKSELGQFPDSFARLIPRASSSSTRRSTLQQLEQFLSKPLPQSVIEAIESWDLGAYESCSFQFGSTGDFAKKVIDEYNAERPRPPWWEDEQWDGNQRPDHLLMIAHGDPWVALLDVENGRILVYEADDGWSAAKTVADSLDQFLRGLGTAEFGHIETGASLAALVGNEVEESFWCEMHEWAPD